MEFGVMPLSGNILNDGAQSSLETISPDQIELFDNSPPNSNKYIRLLPLNKSFSQIDIKNDIHTFGRGDGCDHKFADKADKCLQAYSKLHFSIITKRANGRCVYLLDNSSNGTFINGKLVGKNCKQVLKSDDEISISLPKNRAYIYIDTREQNNLYPLSLTKKYIISRTLGKGATADVKLVFEHGTAKPFAMKIINKDYLSFAEHLNNNTMRIISEINILKSIDHPNIVKYVDAHESSDTMYALIEYVEGGDLFKKIKRQGKLSEPIAKSILREVAFGMQYLHSKNITHRDLKAENILITLDGHAKITDFGLSKYIDSKTTLKTFCGTEIYMAPELMQSASKGTTYTNMVDTWSFGVLLYICLCGYPPFSQERQDYPLKLQIIQAKYILHNKFWSAISLQAKDLLSRLLCRDPASRLTFQQVVEHPWFQDEASLDLMVQPAIQIATPLKDIDEPVKLIAKNSTPCDLAVVPKPSSSRPQSPPKKAMKRKAKDTFCEDIIDCVPEKQLK